MFPQSILQPSNCRLIYLGQDEWCHAACALWLGIKAPSRGNYSGLLRGLSQGLGQNVPRETDSCKHCGYGIKSTIAAKCQAPGCTKVMHFYCAALVGWVVIDKYNTFCGRHKPRQSRPREKKETKSEMVLVKSEPQSEVTTGKPATMAITPVVKTEPNIPKTGKPALFEKMMTEKSSPMKPKSNPMADKPIMFPSNKPPQAPKPQMDPATIQSSILSQNKDLTTDERQNLNRLIDSLFSDEKPTSAPSKPPTQVSRPAQSTTQVRPPTQIAPTQLVTSRPVQPAVQSRPTQPQVQNGRPVQPPAQSRAPVFSNPPKGTFVLASSSLGGVVPRKPTPPLIQKPSPGGPPPLKSFPQQQQLPRLQHMSQQQARFPHPPQMVERPPQQRLLPDQTTAPPSSSTQSTTHVRHGGRINEFCLKSQN